METNWKEWIKEIDFKSTATRRRHILKWLDDRQVKYTPHIYSTGTNIMVHLGVGKNFFAISCHIDRVKGSGGANDNASAMAVCLQVIDNYLTNKCKTNLLVLFFDEEETGLKGSRAYVNDIGTDHISSLINLELVGNGEYGILWPVKKRVNDISHRLQQATLEDQFFKEPYLGMPDFPLYYSDADAFLESGFKNAVTITCLSKNDFELAKQYLEMKNDGSDEDELYSLINQTEIMQYYHSKRDNYGMINQNNIVLISQILITIF